MRVVEPESILNQAKEIFIRTYDHLRGTHEQFYKELLKCQYDKQEILSKIVNVSKAQELILLELCTDCENLQMGDIGKFTMKMHLQNMQIIKWVLANIASFPSSQSLSTSKSKRSSVRAYSKKKRFQGEASHQFYRMKQNSLFMAQGISKEIAQMQDSIDNEINYERVEIDSILQNREFVERIYPSNNEHLLFQAVDVISHQSEVFKKLAQDNKESFANTFKQLNLKPYSKLKVEIDEAMKDKVMKANEKLFSTLNKFIGKKNGHDSKNKPNTKQEEVQVDLTHIIEDKYLLEEKRKAQKIKQLNQSLNQEKTKVEKLQSILKQKVNYFQEKLIKVRFEKSKENQISLLKKSLTQITSINNFKSEVEQTGDQRKKDENSQMFKKSPKYNKTAKINKKVVLKESQEVAYQKTLTRIKFNIQDDPNEEISSRSEIIRDLKICNMETAYCYSPKETSLVKNLSCRSIQQYKSYMKSRFSFCLNVYDYGLKISEPLKKNPSMLTITNIKRKDENESRQIKVAHSADRSSFSNTNYYSGQKKGKRNLKSHQFFRMTCEDQLQEAPIIAQNNEPKEIKCQNNQKANQIKRLSKHNAKDNFEVLELSNETYCKNTNRMNLIMNELKKKRNYRSGISPYKVNKNESQIYQSQIEPAAILQLYLSQENAMEAEIEFSVSVANLIEDRKNLKETPHNLSQNQKKEDYCEQLCKKILKQIHFRKRDPRIQTQIQNAIKRPFSVLKRAPLCKSQAKQFLSEQEIKNFIRFITNLHFTCERKPCLHLTQFLSKLGLNFA